MGGYEDELAKWLRDVDKRERVAESRHKEVLAVQRQGFEMVTKAIHEGFRLVHDAILDTRR